MHLLFRDSIIITDFCVIFFQNDGVVFELNGVNYLFRGTISLVAGDNLASQYLGGYKGLSSALRKCRHCMAVDDDIQSKVFFFKFLVSYYTPKCFILTVFV